MKRAKKNPRFPLNQSLTLLYVASGIDQVVQLMYVLYTSRSQVMKFLDSLESLGLVSYTYKVVDTSPGERSRVRSYTLSTETLEEIAEIKSKSIGEMVEEMKKS